MAVCHQCHHWIETHANVCREVGVIDTQREARIGTAWLLSQQ